MSGVFQPECDCALIGAGRAVPELVVERHRTDLEACWAAVRHWERRFAEDRGGPEHRYWCVHGPSGHLIAVHNSPLGELPPVEEELR